jgi:hypothetical protein
LAISTNDSDGAATPISIAIRMPERVQLIFNPSWPLHSQDAFDERGILKTASGSGFEPEYLMITIDSSFGIDSASPSSRNLIPGLLA